MFYTGTQWMVRFSRIRSNRIGFSEAIFVSDGIGLRDWSFGLDYLRIHVVGESSYFRLPIEGAMTSASRGWQAGIGVCPILSPELHFSHLKTIKDTFKFQILPDAAWVISFGKKNMTVCNTSLQTAVWVVLTLSIHCTSLSKYRDSLQGNIVTRHMFVWLI